MKSLILLMAVAGLAVGGISCAAVQRQVTYPTATTNIPPLIQEIKAVAPTVEAVLPPPWNELFAGVAGLLTVGISAYAAAHAKSANAAATAGLAQAQANAATLAATQPMPNV